MTSAQAYLSNPIPKCSTEQNTAPALEPDPIRGMLSRGSLDKSQKIDELDKTPTRTRSRGRDNNH